MNDDYMSEADNEVDGGYFADLEYSYQQKEIRRQEDKENKAKKEENRKQQLLRQNKCIENLKIKINKLKQQLAETEQRFLEFQEDSIRNEQTYVRELAEKDKEIKSLIVDYEKRISQEQELMSNMEHRLTEKQNTIDEINKEFVQAVHDWKTLCAEKDKEIEKLKQQNTLLENENGKLAKELIVKNYKKAQKEVSFGIQLAIQELAEVERLLYESHYKEIDNRYYAEYEDIKNLIDSRIQALEELKGEKDVKD